MILLTVGCRSGSRDSNPMEARCARKKVFASDQPLKFSETQPQKRYPPADVRPVLGWSISFIISSVPRIASDMASVIAGTRFPPSCCGEKRQKTQGRLRIRPMVDIRWVEEETAAQVASASRAPSTPSNIYNFFGCKSTARFANSKES